MDITPYFARFAHLKALQGDPLTYVGRYVTTAIGGIARRMCVREACGTRVIENRVGHFHALSFLRAPGDVPSLTLLWGAMPDRRRDRQTCLVADVTPQKGRTQKADLVVRFDLSGKEVLICLLSEHPTDPSEKLQEGIGKILAYTRGKLATCSRT